MYNPVKARVDKYSCPLRADRKGRTFMSEPTGTPSPISEELSEQQLSELLQIRRDKLLALQEAGQDPFAITKFDVDAHNAQIRERFDELENQPVVIAGRMMSRRIMGKASFMDLRDRHRSDAGVCQTGRRGRGRGTRHFKKWDIGDIVGVEGLCVPHPAGAKFPCTRTEDQAAVQVAAAAAGEVPRLEGHGHPVPPAVSSTSSSTPRCKDALCQA